MNKVLKNKFILVLALLLSIFVIGCGGQGGITPPDESKFNEANYKMDSVYTFEKELTLEEVKAAINSANEAFSSIKTYSYTNKLTGSYEGDYSFEGITVVDASGATPKASVELTGSATYAFYMTDNKLYFNYNGYKVYYTHEAGVEGFVSTVQAQIGAFEAFSVEDITAESLKFAGVDKDKATVVNYLATEGTNVVIVIHNSKIAKVLYSNMDGTEYVMVYNYESATVTLPADLDSYTKAN